MAKATKTTAPAKAKAKDCFKAGRRYGQAESATRPKPPPPSQRRPRRRRRQAPSRRPESRGQSPPPQSRRGKAGAAKPAPKAGIGKARDRPPAKKLPKALTALAAGLPEKPWLKSYPKDVPAEIGALPYSSIGDFLVGACKQFSGQPAFICMGKSITYAELERQSAAFGAYLQSKGLQKGARVALMMPNVLQYPVAMMAVLRAGYVVVNVNPLYTPRELEHQLKDSGAQAIVILENFASTLQAVIARTAVKHVVVAAMGDMLGGLKGTIVNLVVRRVKKMVPAWSLPGHVKFNAAVKAGAGIAFKPAKVEAERRRLPAIYRRHHGCFQGR